MLNVEVPLSFALPTAAASDQARYKTTDEEGDDSYTYYRRSLDDEKADMYSYAENFISQSVLNADRVTPVCITSGPLIHAIIIHAVQSVRMTS